MPLPSSATPNIPKTSRLKYRFLDLPPRPYSRQHHEARRHYQNSLRRRMKEQGFFEFQTPILTASSPEGARDYLVPSRVHPGKFYALPQAPAAVQAAPDDVGALTGASSAPRASATKMRAPTAARQIVPARYRDEFCHPAGRVRCGRARVARRVRGGLPAAGFPSRRNSR